MKKIFASIIFSAVAVYSYSAELGYIYKGSGDITDASSWFYITGGSTIGNANWVPLYPSEYTGAYTTKGDAGNYGIFSENTVAPSATSILAFMRYGVGTIGATTDEITFTQNASTASDYGKVSFKNSTTAAKFIARSYWERNYELGSSTSADSEFVLNITGSMGLWYTGKQHIKVASTAAQTIFKLNVGGEFHVQSGAASLVDIGVGQAFDEVTFGSLYSDVKLSIFTKSLNVVGNASLVANSVLTLGVSKLDEDGVLFTFGGKLSKTATDKILLDFSNVTISSGDLGTYNILSVGSLSGFDADSVVANDFTISGISDTVDYNFAWNNNVLQLNVVPEPATIVAIFGVMALAVAAYRRRK